MARKQCFGSIKEIVLDNGMTMTQTRDECRDCADFRDCLFHGKKNADEGKQNLIARIIDHSEVVSNELGTCLLEFLNRMYGNPVGKALFNGLVLFFEVPPNSSSLTVTVPLSRSLLESIHAVGGESTEPFDPTKIDHHEAPARSLMLRIILLQRRFPNNRKANIGLIVHEVASMLSSNDHGTNQVIEVLPESDGRIFRKMDVRLRMNWLIEKWGFQKEHEAFRNEVSRLGSEENKWAF